METIIECVKVTGYIQIITVKFDDKHQPTSNTTTWLKEGSKLYTKALKGIS